MRELVNVGCIYRRRASFLFSLAPRSLQLFDREWVFSDNSSTKLDGNLLRSWGVRSLSRFGDGVSERGELNRALNRLIGTFVRRATNPALKIHLRTKREVGNVFLCAFIQSSIILFWTFSYFWYSSLFANASTGDYLNRRWIYISLIGATSLILFFSLS